MAREHARVKLTIWEDDDFRQLSAPAQHLYFVLMTSPKLDYAGVTDWRPARIAQLAGGWTPEAVEIAAQELSEALYLIIDAESEEVLIRSFVRSDGLLEQPNLAVAARKAHASVASAALRAIIVHELIRLHADKPTLRGWSKIAELLERTSLDPSEYPTFEASRNPFDDPSGKGEPKGSDNPSRKVSPTTATSPSTSPATDSPTEEPTTGEGAFKGNRYETLHAVPDTKPRPTCARHPNGNPNDDPCGGCARSREWDAKHDADYRAAEAAAAANCGTCHGTGWLEHPDNGLPAGKCNHRRTA
jgi:hypothetical protein